CGGGGGGGGGAPRGGGARGGPGGPAGSLGRCGGGGGGGGRRRGRAGGAGGVVWVVLVVKRPAAALAGGLWFWARDGEPLADESIEERGFPSVGSSGYGDGSGFGHHIRTIRPEG